MRCLREIRTERQNIRSPVIFPEDQSYALCRPNIVGLKLRRLHAHFDNENLFFTFAATAALNESRVLKNSTGEHRRRLFGPRNRERLRRKDNSTDIKKLFWHTHPARGAERVTIAATPPANAFSSVAL